MKYASDVRCDKKKVLDCIEEMTRELIKAPHVRQELGSKARSMIDGKGQPES